MTIDEAIKFCYEKAWDIKLKTEPQTFLDIAERLEELKRFKSYKPVDKEFYKAGYTKAIDDFVDKVEFVVGAEDRDIYCKETVKEVAEQLKAGGSDD